MGGQFRILVRDLREFMIDQGMETDLLDRAYDTRRYCWEFCDGDGAAPLMGSSCEDCLIRRSQALNCFELRSALSHGADELEVCLHCRYLCRWRLGDASPPGDHREPRDRPELSMGMCGD